MNAKEGIKNYFADFVCKRVLLSALRAFYVFQCIATVTANVPKQFLTSSLYRLLIKWNHVLQGKTQHQNSQHLHFVENFAIKCWCINQNCYYASSMPLYNSQCQKRRDTPLPTVWQIIAFSTFFIKFKEAYCIPQYFTRGSIDWDA